MTITDRIDTITKIPESHLLPRPPAPRSVKIELTGRCNFACSFCARSSTLRRQEDMSMGLFRRVIREFRAAGVEELGLFYLGESFMFPELTTAIDDAKNNVGFPYVFLTTNGSLSTPDLVEDAMRAGLDSLKFSFNYSDAKQFREITKCRGDLWQLVKSNIVAAWAVRDKVEALTGHRCGLYASYIEYDGEQAERMKAAVAEIEPYVDQVYALPLYTQAALQTEAEIARGWEPTAGNRGRSGALRDPLPCWAAFTEGHVTWDGKLSACCFDHDGRFEMGDLTKESFEDAWASETFARLREAHIARDVTGTACESCAAYSG